MKHRAFLSLLPICLLPLLAGCAPDGEAEAMPEVEAATAPAAPPRHPLDALRDRWVEQYNMHQADAVAALYADSAWILDADMSVDEGRAAVAEAHMAAMASSPTVAVTTNEKLIMGDQGVALGEYQVDATAPDGQPATWSGAWLGYFRQVGGEWKIAGRITNYDTPRPDGWMWSESPHTTRAEESTVTELIGQYETAFNAGDAVAVGEMYSEDASVALAFAPPVRGRAALVTNLESRFAAREVVIDIHGIETVDLDESHKLDGGWYELTDSASGEVVQSGMYLNLLEQAEDGSWKIKWAVSNGRPTPGIEAADPAASGS